MSREIKRQLAEIRRQVGKDEIARMRAHVKNRQARLTQLQQERRAFDKQRRLERRARLDKLRVELVQTRKRPIEERRKMLRTLSEKRRSFHEWWAAVRIERASKLAEIASLRQELKAFGQQWAERKRLAVEAITAAVHKELDQFDEQTEQQLDSLEALIGKARQELKVEQYDLKSWIRNRSGERKPKSKAKPAQRVRERRAERESLIELNLVNAEEQAWWRRNKAQILRRATELGITEPDGIAELVRESVEADPERAVEFLQSDADRWLATELRKQGYAA